MSTIVDPHPGSGADDPGPDPEDLEAQAPEARAEVEQADVEQADVEQADVEQDGPAPSPAQLRVDFGAHLEANYQRLVAQLYAITLDPGEAHDVVQDAYSRAWRSWATVSRSEDPTAWVRRVAVRSTIRSWRRVLARVGIGRPKAVGEGVDPRTGAMLAALGRLPAPERRCVVLSHMAGASLSEIAAVEQVSRGTVQARLARARQVVTEGMADVLPEVLGQEAGAYAPDSYGGPYAEQSRAGEYDSGEYDAGTYDAGEYDAVYDNKGEYR
jgi:DNA-directed RNA polymerase specialized sigma24 family protein